MKKCNVCKRILSETEIEYYGVCCEYCEGILVKSLAKGREYPWLRRVLLGYQNRCITALKRILREKHRGR